MYHGYFGLREAPFSITPNPRFVFLSRQHQDALAHLLYGIGRGGGGGFVQVTGEVGTGKTTLCRCLLEQLSDEVRVALILNPRLSPAELIASICDELRIRYPRRSRSIKVLVDALNRYLLRAHAEGQRVAVVIDEAQNLDRDALEQIRLLTNLETPTQKLLQIILVGQPELRTLLASPDLRQLAQRVTARYHLKPLDAEETAAYVQHRMAVAGAQHRLFTRGALGALFRRSGGVPRLINVMADRALLGAYGLDKRRVTRRIVHRAADEVLGTRSRPWSRAVFATVALTGVVALASAYWPLHRADSADEDPAVALATPANPAAAWGGLLALWGADGDAADCRAALDQGLNCTRLSGNWNSVRALNRPVILHLRAQGTPDRAVDALLTGLGTTHLRVRLAGKEHQWPIRAVDPLWLGDFTVVWSAPFPVSEPLALGHESEAVAWLRARVLDLEDGLETDPGDTRFDASLQAWTRRFQATRGLAPDGVLGERTWLHATSFFDEPATPRLESVPDAPGT